MKNVFKVLTATLIFGGIAFTAVSFTSGADTTSGNVSPQQRAVGTNVGDIAPDIEMASPDGKTYKLSDLRGQVVLIDFWASWCGPCRRENPNLVKAYNKYNEADYKNAEGFTIFSVSLDRDKRAWEKAISQDKLAWPYHVSDLKLWNNAAAQRYGIQAIPDNVLIDENGVIIAKRLRGGALHLKLDQMVESL